MQTCWFTTLLQASKGGRLNSHCECCAGSFDTPASKINMASFETVSCSDLWQGKHLIRYGGSRGERMHSCPMQQQRLTLCLLWEEQGVTSWHGGARLGVYPGGLWAPSCWLALPAALMWAHCHLQSKIAIRNGRSGFMEPPPHPSPLPNQTPCLHQREKLECTISFS